MLEQQAARMRARQLVDAVAALVAVIVGPVLLYRASRSERLWEVLGLAVVGLVLLAVALLWANDRLEDLNWPRWLVAAALPLGAALLYAAMHWNSRPLGIVATALGAIGAMATHQALKQSIDQHPPGDPVVAPVETIPATSPTKHALAPLALPTQLVALGIGIVWALDWFTPLAWLGLVVMMVGTILFKQQMTDLVYCRVVARDTALKRSAQASVAGVLILLGSASAGSQLGVLIGAAVTFCGLSVLGLALLYLQMTTAQAIVVAVGGAGVLAAGWLVAWLALKVPGWAWVLTVLVGVVGAWFVFRGEAIIAVILVGFVGVWAIAPGYADAGADPNPTATTRMLAIGDSFSAGEGAGRYLDGTNQVGLDRNECRRAPTAYPYLVAVELGYGLDFFSCSGAASADLTTCGQMAEGDLRCQPLADWPPVELDRAEREVAGRRPQLANLTTDELAEIDVVLLQIGGNDVGFSTIVKACLLPRSCSERAEDWYANVTALEPKLVDTYATIRAQVGEDVPVVVVPYPRVVDPEPCTAGLDDDEYQFIVSFTEQLDATIERAAATAGVHYWADGVGVFEGRRLCDRRPAVNHLRLRPPNGAPLQRLAPATWVHDSMHPNEDGHELIAAPLAQFVAAAAASGPPAAVPVDTEAPQPTPVDNSAADGTWITAQLYDTVRSLLVPIVLTLLGSIATAVGLLNIPWFDILRPRRGWWKWADDEEQRRIAEARASGASELAQAL